MLFHYQRCHRRAYLDLFGDESLQDAPSDYLLKLRQDSVSHRQLTLETFQPLARPDYAAGDWEAGAQATLELMAAGAEVIYHGVVITAGPLGAGQAGEPTRSAGQRVGVVALGQLVLHPHRHQAGQKTKT